MSLWWPAYGAQALLKVGVALISIAAAIAIWRLIPMLGAYPTPEEIETQRETEIRLRDREAALSDALYSLQNANKAKANFFAAMSHDLRTPLNAILGFSEALKLEIFGRMANARQAEYVDHIRSSGAQLQTLINDLLDLSGAESGKRTISPEPLAARPLLEEIVNQFEMSSAAQNRRVRITLICEVDTILADRTSFRRIINNLLANSAKYGGRDAIIVIVVTRRGGGVELTVTDEGPGFPAGRIDSMRAPFTRENVSDDGLGIGLAIVDTLIQQHGGEMTLDNASQGGARITLDFPLPASAIPRHGESPRDRAMGAAVA